MEVIKLKYKSLAVFFAVLAAVLYAINIPCSKLLFNNVGEVMMAAFLYFGAGVGMIVMSLFKSDRNEERLVKEDLPYTIAMVVLDIIAPILLMFGLNLSNPENVSLLNNFEIVATAVIAYIIFKEHISLKLTLAIILVTIACGILSFKNLNAFKFSSGSILVLLASTVWGFENNCTRKISHKDPLQIVMIKGIFSGLGSFIIALIVQEKIPESKYIVLVMLIGFVSYGLSIYFYVKAQRVLGAAKTSTYYAIAPFVGGLFSLVIFRTLPGISFYVALVFMGGGTYLAGKDI